MFLYLDRHSILHRLHPVTKIVGLALVFALPFYSSDPLVVSAAFGFALALLLIARAMPNLRKAVLLMVLLALSSTVLWSVFAPGQTEILRLGFLTVTRESLTYGIAMALRLNGVILAGLAFLSCTRIEELSWGLHRIGVPYALSFALSLAFRLVSLFFQTTHQIVQAQKARGLDLDSGPIFSRIRKHVPLLIPVFLYGVRNVDLMAMALESRGFRATSRRTHYLAYSIGGSDYVILLLLTALNAGCLWLRLRG
jgi:energy-coupling factor transport system permease protein